MTHPILTEPHPPAPPEQLDGETPEAFEALCAFLGLGRGRTIDMAARCAGAATIDANGWAHVYKWRERAHAFDLQERLYRAMLKDYNRRKRSLLARGVELQALEVLPDATVRMGMIAQDGDDKDAVAATRVLMSLAGGGAAGLGAGDLEDDDAATAEGPAERARMLDRLSDDERAELARLLAKARGGGA